MAAAQKRVFAVLLHERSTAVRPPTGLLSALADQGVVAVMGRPSELSSTALSALSPHAWSYAAGADQVQRATAAFLCDQLVGRSASFSRRCATAAVAWVCSSPRGSRSTSSSTGWHACHSTPEVEVFAVSSASPRAQRCWGSGCRA